MAPLLTRRSFALGSAAFAGLALAACAPAGRSTARHGLGYGPLRPDPAGLLDLPEGFSYRIVSRLGDRMDEGFFVPDRADGMGAIPLDDRRIALIRNHELRPNHHADGPFRGGAVDAHGFDSPGGLPLPGGTTTLIYDYRAHRVEAQYLSLAGTIRNCAGGTTPWGSWLTSSSQVSQEPQGVVPPAQLRMVPARLRYWASTRWAR